MNTPPCVLILGINLDLTGFKKVVEAENEKGVGNVANSWVGMSHMSRAAAGSTDTARATSGLMGSSDAGNGDDAAVLGTTSSSLVCFNR